MYLGFRVYYTLHVLDSMFIVSLCSSSVIIYVLGSRVYYTLHALDSVVTLCLSSIIIYVLRV